MSASRGNVLLLSENAPVPSDRRVWNESRTLTSAGYAVTIVCARGEARGRAPYELREGIEIHRYPLQPAERARDYPREYAQALWRSRRIVRRLARRRRFDVVHACNPPDFLLLAALAARRRGARLVFDHHDLVPELYRSRFGGGDGIAHRLTLLTERLAFGLADVSLATNESYREIAVGRGRKDPDDVFVVRNGPDLARFTPVAADPGLKRGQRHLIAYLGVMARQDGIDHALRALAELHRRRDDWHATFAGEGEQLEPMRRLAADLGIAHRVEFTGWLLDDGIRRLLCTADVCVAPDPPSPLNELSTMVKIPEYMAMGKPVVSYDLRESRRSAGDAGAYARPGDHRELGRRLDELLADPARRVAMGAVARARVERELAWDHSALALLAAYERALRMPAPDGRYRVRQRARRGDGLWPPATQSSNAPMSYQGRDPEPRSRIAGSSTRR